MKQVFIIYSGPVGFKCNVGIYVTYFTLGFKLPVGDVDGPSKRHSGPVQEI